MTYRLPRTFTPLLSVPLKYALIGSVLIIMLFFVIVFFDNNPLLSNKAATIPLSIIFIFFSIKEFKNYHNQRILHFWQGMAVGYLTYGLIAVLTALFLWGYASAFGTDLLPGYITNRTAFIMNHKENFIEQFGEETYRETLADIKVLTLATLVWEDLKKILLVGLFITLIIAIVMRRNPLTEKKG